MSDKLIRYRDLTPEQKENFKALAKSKNIKLPKGYATCGAEKFADLFASIIESNIINQVDIDEVIEQKKTKEQLPTTLKSINPRFKTFGDLQQFDFNLSERFISFCKLFKNKQLNTNGFIIDTEKKEITKDGLLIFKN